MTLPKSENDTCRVASGEVSYGDKLTSFLYDLMRDHLPTGVAQKLVRDAQSTPVHFTNGWLAKYAHYLADRLAPVQREGVSTKASDKQISAARRLYGSSCVQIDVSAEESRGTEEGAWVQAWVWVPDAETEK